MCSLVDSFRPMRSRNNLSRVARMQLFQHAEALLRNGKRAFLRQGLCGLFHLHMRQDFQYAGRFSVADCLRHCQGCGVSGACGQVAQDPAACFGRIWSRRQESSRFVRRHGDVKLMGKSGRYVLWEPVHGRPPPATR
jgi:hypothetical protein